MNEYDESNLPVSIRYIKKLIPTNPAEAKVRLERLLRNEPKDPLVYGLYAMLMLKLNQPQIALTHLNEIIELNPEHYLENYYNRAYCHYQLATKNRTDEAQQLELALKDIKAAIKIGAEGKLLIQCYELMKEIHQMQGAKAALAKDYKKLAELTNDQSLLLIAGEIEKELDLNKRAKSTYRTIINKTTASRSGAAIALTEEQRFSNLQAKIELFDSYKKDNKFQLALKVIQEIITDFPDSGEYYFGLGNLYLTPEAKFYAPEKAIECFNQAQKLHYDHPFLPFNLGLAERSLGHYPAAQQHLINALAQYPLAHQERHNIYKVCISIDHEYIVQMSEADNTDNLEFIGYLNKSYELVNRAAIEFLHDHSFIQSIPHYLNFFTLFELPVPDISEVKASHAESCAMQAARCGNAKDLQALISDLPAQQINYQEPATEETILHAMLTSKPPFDKAIQYENFKKLHDKGFNLMLQDTQGNTVIHIACQQKNIYMLIALLTERKQGERYLLRSNLDLTIANKSGETVEDCFKKLLKADKTLKTQANIKIVQDLFKQFHDKQPSQQMAKLKL